MSAFETTTSEDTSNTQDTTQTTEDYLQEVVKLKGEHWTDPNTLAKGYYHAQQRIKELEVLAEKAKEQDYAKRLLEQLQQQAPASTQRVAEDNKGSQENDNTRLTPDELQSLIEKTLTVREQTATVQQNLSAADSKLTDLYGTEAKVTVQKKARELGMSVERLRDIAGESPTAFFRLIGEEAPVKENNSMTKATVNTGAGFTDNRGGERTQEYYTKLRRENRSLYNRPEIQNQMMQDRVRLGEKFYK